MVSFRWDQHTARGLQRFGNKGGHLVRPKAGDGCFHLGHLFIKKDGRVYLPDMGFEVQLGTARAHYQGIDPRAGVLFPGIQKSPR